jgi:hypothetical protein
MMSEFNRVEMVGKLPSLPAQENIHPGQTASATTQNLESVLNGLMENPNPQAPHDEVFTNAHVIAQTLVTPHFFGRAVLCFLTKSLPIFSIPPE